jgi:hypothetical protein
MVVKLLCLINVGTAVAREMLFTELYLQLSLSRKWKKSEMVSHLDNT